MTSEPIVDQNIDDRFYTIRSTGRKNEEAIQYANSPPTSSLLDIYKEEQKEEEIQDIFWLTKHNCIKEVEGFIVNGGIPINARDEFGNTILSIACQYGHKRIVKMALRHGANINIQNYKGNTPLHFCFAYGFGETLGAYLLSKGADPSIVNKERLLCYQ